MRLSYLIKQPRSLLSNLPPLSCSDDLVQRKKRAKWDLIEGILFWELWVRLSMNEMRRRYKRTLLGPAWITLSLLIFALTMSLVWAGLWNQKVVDFLPFLLSGLVPWTMISSVIGESTAVFLAGESLIKNQQFPYSLLSYGVISRNFIIFGHNLIGYFLIAMLCGIKISPAILLIIPGLILVLANLFWMSLAVAIFCLRFRDFQQIIASLIQIAVFVTPIFWNADQIQGKRLIIVHANLLHHMVEILRRPLLGEIPSIISYLFCLISAIIGIFFSYRLFISKRHRLAYWF